MEVLGPKVLIDGSHRASVVAAVWAHVVPALHYHASRLLHFGIVGRAQLVLPVDLVPWDSIVPTPDLEQIETLPVVPVSLPRPLRVSGQAQLFVRPVPEFPFRSLAANVVVLVHRRHLR